jgi:hypothetical protein
VNGDGYDDIIAGAPYYPLNYYTGNVGAAFVWLGSAGGLGANGNLSNVDWWFVGDRGQGYLGNVVGSAGDVNSDGYDDIIVGAGEYSHTQVNEGVTLVFSGSGSGPSHSPNWIGTGNQYQVYYGMSSAGARDVNNDGYDDLIVGEPFYSSDPSTQYFEGIAYAYHGGPDTAIAGLVATNNGPTTPGNPTTLSASITSGSGVAYTWDFGDGTGSWWRVMAHTYPGPGIYTAVVTASNTINVMTDTTTVVVADIPITGLEATNDSPTEFGQATTLTATVVTGSNVVYYWNFGDGSTANGRVVHHTYPHTGLYTATVTASNSQGYAIDTTTVTIYRECWARLNNSPTDYLTVQAAVDASASPVDVVKVAGTCSGVNHYAGLAQTVYISKTITIQGGYTETNWTTPDPLVNPTTLDANSLGRILYITGNIAPTIKGLRLTGGDADGLGGGPPGVNTGGGIEIITATTTIQNCEIFGNTADFGGGLDMAFSSSTIAWNYIHDNFASAEGGGMMLYTSGATLANNIIVSNTAGTTEGGSGGGVFVRQGNGTLLAKNTIASNSAVFDPPTETGGEGGGLVVEYSDISIEDNIISGNHAGTIGGGVFMEGGSSVFNGNRVVSNTADGEGGGLFLEMADITLLYNQVMSNTAGDNGGGMLLASVAVTLTGNTITHNASVWDGAGLRVNNSTALVDRNIITHNSAGGDGGGLFLDMTDARLTNTVIAYNQAERGCGLFVQGSSPHLLHTTIAGNSGGNGVGIYFNDDPQFPYSHIVLTNTILVNHSIGISVTWGNSVTVNDILWDASTPITISHGVTATVEIQNQHTGDPAFAADGYHLTDSSDAIDIAIPVGVFLDIDNEPRPMRLGYDLGADEAPDETIAGLVVTNSSPTELGHPTLFTATITAGTNVLYGWDFGDGQTVSLGPWAVISHTYPAAGVYTVVISATNPVTKAWAQTIATVYETISMPTGGGEYTTSDGILTFTWPAGLTQTLTITYTPQLTPSHAMGDLEFAGIVFHLDAVDENGNPITAFSPPLTLTLHYDESALPPGMDESELELCRYDAGLGGWVPLLLVSRDTVANTVTVLLDHFSEFALLRSPVRQIYLPLIIRKVP